MDHGCAPNCSKVAEETSVAAIIWHGRSDGAWAATHEAVSKAVMAHGPCIDFYEYRAGRQDGAMADASLSAMAGVTAADHEQISKS